MRKQQLPDSINPDSADMFTASLIGVHYPDRPDELSSMCLHDFAKYTDWYHRDEKVYKTYRRLAKPRVVNHPVYDPNRKEQEEDYYYCVVLLFVSYTDESDLLLPGESAKQAYERSSNKGLLAHLERLLKMLEAAKKRREISEARKADKEDPQEDEDEGPQVKGKPTQSVPKDHQPLVA